MSGSPRTPTRIVLSRVLGALVLLAPPAPLAAQDPAAKVQATTIDWSTKAADYLASTRARTLDACKARGLDLPADFLAWIDGDPIVRTSVYGCRRDPLPVLLGLRSLEIDLGEGLVRRDYPQLALAFAIQGSYRAPSTKASGWNDGDDPAGSQQLPDISPRPLLQLVIPGDPRVRVDTLDAGRPLDRDDHIVNFLEDHAEIEVEVPTKQLPPLEYDDKGVAKPRGKAMTVMQKQTRPLVAADVIASAALQAEFNAYMAAHGHKEVAIDCGDQVVHWFAKEAVADKALRERIKAAFDLFHDAYRHKGRMPAERDRAPSPAESMAWFVRNDRQPFSDADRKAREWPRFPLNAPWPLLLMLAADDQPLREREEIWSRFRDNGELRTYGEYIGGIAQQFDMQSARRVSPFPFSYGSIEMMWKDGGVCGTMGNIGARTWRICGVPSSTAGQPGHCAIVLMTHDKKTGMYTCEGGQYATGGDEVTTVHAGWNYDDVGGRKPMMFHQTVAWGINHGLPSYLQTLVMRRAFDALDAEERAAGGLALLAQGLLQNPFAMVLVEAAIATAKDQPTLIALLDAFDARLAAATKPTEYPLYKSTVRDLVHARMAQLPVPTTREPCAALLRELERQGCQQPQLLAKCWRAIDGEAGFAARCQAAVGSYLASPLRSKNRGEAERFARCIEAWGKTIVGKAAKQAWAEELLSQCQGKEALVIRRKRSLDPVVAALCKLAGRPAPEI